MENPQVDKTGMWIQRVAIGMGVALVIWIAGSIFSTGIIRDEMAILPSPGPVRMAPGDIIIPTPPPNVACTSTKAKSHGNMVVVKICKKIPLKKIQPRKIQSRKIAPIPKKS